MGKYYVVNGAKVSCSMGTVNAPLRTTPGRRVQLGGKDKANILDCIPMVNVGPFGVCKVTQMPCAPVCTPWLNGKNDVLVGGMPALLDNSITICSVGGGVLKFEDDGQ